MSDRITITIWRSLTDPHGTRATVTWIELCAMLSKPQTIGLVLSSKKERKGKLDPDKGRLTGWSGAKFTDDERKKAACESVTVECIDYDGGVTIEQAVALWGKYRGFLHTSPSHQFDDYGDRFRVLLQTSRSVTPEEHERIFAWIKARCDAAGHTIDVAPKDPSRLWFMPGRLKDAPFETRELSGEVLDVDAVLAEVPAKKTKQATLPRAAKQAAATPDSSEPSRHVTLVRAGARMRGRGAEPDHIAAALNEINAEFEASKPDSEVAKIAEWAGKLPDGTEQWFKYSDTSNADEIIRDHGSVLRACHECGWLHYNAGRWTRNVKIPIELAEKTMRRVAVEAVHKGEDGKLITKLLKRDTATSALGFVDPRLAVRIDKFDAKPRTLNVYDGTLDLYTSELKPHDPSDLFTKQSPIAYNQNAKAPKWIECLETWLPDVEVRAFVQRLAGYWLTGEVQEHVLPVFYGKGANGKSTFLEALQRVMGDYAKAVPASLLMERDYEQHPTERAQLLGLRLAVASESKQQRSLDEGTVKLLTGGDRIPARFMHKDWFEFEPTHKLVLSTNYKPIIKGTDEGIWRRVLLVPWDVVVPKAKRDTKLGTTLRAEAPGILAWAVQGCREWQRTGLAPPKAVQAATDAFRIASDIVGRFIDERCTIKVQTARIKASSLYAAFESWCKDNGEKPLWQNAFGEELLNRGFERKAANSGRFYVGIGIHTTPTDQTDPTSSTRSVEPVDSTPTKHPMRACEGQHTGKASQASQAPLANIDRTIACETCGGRIDGYSVCSECGAGADPAGTGLQ